MSGRWRIVQSVQPTIHVNPICPYPSLHFEVDTRALLEEVMIDLHVIVDSGRMPMNKVARRQAYYFTACGVGPRSA